jgi:hypothetical protein
MPVAWNRAPPSPLVARGSELHVPGEGLEEAFTLWSRFDAVALGEWCILGCGPRERRRRRREGK